MAYFAISGPKWKYANRKEKIAVSAEAAGRWVEQVFGGREAFGTPGRG